MKYSLEPYNGVKSRTTCPKCKVKHSFTRFVDSQGFYVGNWDDGRCNRMERCGYYKTPDSKHTLNLEHIGHIVEKEPTYLSDNQIVGTKYKDNLFYFLREKYDEERVMEVYNMFGVRSTNKKWANSTIFYQIDKQGNYRTGKIMNYSTKDGKRIKKPYNRFSWVHTKISEFNLVQCYFGTNNANNQPTNTVGIVESEKTAIVMTLENPEFSWVATGGLTNINLRSIIPLLGKRLIAYPDKGSFTLWEEKFKHYNVKVSSLVESLDGLKQGDDLADYYLT